MIVSQQKPFEEILRALGDEKRIYLVGCGECATLCKTGGEEELEIMKQGLEKKRAIELYQELKELCRGEDEALYRMIDDILIDELKDLDEFSNMFEE